MEREKTKQRHMYMCLTGVCVCRCLLECTVLSSLHSVGDRNKYEIHLPLPPKIDPTVTMMQVSRQRQGWGEGLLASYLCSCPFDAWE